MYTLLPDFTDEQWDRFISDTLNFVFCNNAQDEMISQQRPFYPMMPLPVDRPICECRDYPEYKWNQLVITFDRVFKVRKYDWCWKLLDEMEALYPTIGEEYTYQTVYIKGYFSATGSPLRDCCTHFRLDLEKVAPKPQVAWVEQKAPIQWRAN